MPVFFVSLYNDYNHVLIGIQFYYVRMLSLYSIIHYFTITSGWVIFLLLTLRLVLGQFRYSLASKYIWDQSSNAISHIVCMCTHCLCFTHMFAISRWKIQSKKENLKQGSKFDLLIRVTVSVKFLSFTRKGN